MNGNNPQLKGAQMTPAFTQPSSYQAVDIYNPTKDLDPFSPTFGNVLPTPPRAPQPPQKSGWEYLKSLFGLR